MNLSAAIADIQTRGLEPKARDEALSRMLKKAFSKAAASEEARRTFRYVEPLSDARTMLAVFFSILLVLPPQEILPLGLTFHPTSYIIRDKALLGPFRRVAFI